MKTTAWTGKYDEQHKCFYICSMQTSK